MILMQSLPSRFLYFVERKIFLKTLCVYRYCVCVHVCVVLKQHILNQRERSLTDKSHSGEGPSSR